MSITNAMQAVAQSATELRAALNGEQAAPSTVLDRPDAMAETCRLGHPLSGDNLYIDPGGRRRCRECNREQVARYYERKRGRAA